MAQSHDADTSGARKANIHGPIKQLLIAIEKGVVEGYADLICVQSRVLLRLLDLLVVLGEHEA